MYPCAVTCAHGGAHKNHVLLIWQKNNHNNGKFQKSAPILFVHTDSRVCAKFGENWRQKWWSQWGNSAKYSLGFIFPRLPYICHILSKSFQVSEETRL